MATKEKKLGASWENGAIHFVESFEGAPEKVFHVPFGEHPQEKTEKKEKGGLDEWEMKLASTIKDALKEQKVSTDIVNLSLPTHDIIFRSFVIPWMQAHEVKNVVEFEVGKYIPFSLKDLSYAHHPVTIHIDGVRHIRVIFVAIKLDALKKYEGIMKAAGLQVKVVEPSALSLIRTLHYKKVLPEDETVAMIEKETAGRIIVSDNNTPLFVREFYLSSPAEETGGAGEMAKKLTKEVRISLDYFNRQNEQLKVGKLFFLSSKNEGELSKELGESLGIPVTAIEKSSVIAEEFQGGVGIIHAYGASLISSVGKLVSFNLSQSTVEAKKSSKSISFSFTTLTKKQWIMLTVLVCAPLIIGSIVMPIIWKQGIKKERLRLKRQLGAFEGSDVDFIQQKEDLLRQKLQNLKSTRIKSDVSTFMVLIPELLPEGTWLRSLDIAYIDGPEDRAAVPRRIGRISDSTKESEPTLILTLDGYAYSENKGKQFQIVNSLMNKLKENEKYASYFKTIELDTIEAQSLYDFDVTYFKIVCKQTDETLRLKQNND